MMNMTAFLVFKAGQYIEEQFALHFEDQPLKARHFCTLRVLHFENSLSQQALCESLWIDRATMTQTVQKLLALKYVKRTAHTEDRRSLMISLTAAGEKFYLDHVHEFERLEKRIFGNLGSTERKHIRESLGAALIAISGPSRSRPAE